MRRSSGDLSARARQVIRDVAPFAVSPTATWRRCYDAGTLESNQRLMRNSIKRAARARFSHVDGLELVRMYVREDLVTSNALSSGHFRNA